MKHPLARILVPFVAVIALRPAAAEKITQKHPDYPVLRLVETRHSAVSQLEESCRQAEKMREAMQLVADLGTPLLPVIDGLASGSLLKSVGKLPGAEGPVEVIESTAGALEVVLGFVAWMNNLGDEYQAPIRSDIAIEPLIRALSSPSIDVQAAAATALMQVGSGCVPYLLEQLESPDYVVRRWVAEILGEIGDETAREALIVALDDSNTRVVHYAAISLGKVGKPSVIRYLARLLDHPDKDVRCAAVEGLAHVGSHQTVRYLSAMLQDEDWVTRLTAVRGLGNVASRTCVAPLIKALSDQEWSVRKHAVDGLARVGIRKGAMKALIDIADDARVAVRRAVAQALGELGDETCIPVLHKLTDDADDKVSEAADAALTKLDPPCPEPED
jgi:HEAT repeat protein